MIDIHLFGITTPTGKYLESIFKNKSEQYNLIGYSRSNKIYNSINFEEENLLIYSNKNILISCAPIWDFANFINILHKKNTNLLNKINSMIVCSSSSVITKKYAFNEFDKALVKKFEVSENKLLDICKNLDIKCFIVRPTMIYGSIEGYHDKNIRLIVKIMRLMPVIFIPKTSGLRQPIHANQLAKVIYFITSFYAFNKENIIASKVFNIGGDEELTYKKLILRLKDAFPKKDPINNCYIAELPITIFILLLIPLSIFSPKLFELFLRMKSNLSGFLKSSIFIKENPKKFPVRPIFK